MGSCLGIRKKMGKIFENGKTIIVPTDDSLIFGPFDGLKDMKATVDKIYEARPNAVLGFNMAYQYLFDKDIAYIFNMTASTVLSNHTRKLRIATTENMVSLGVECVAVHVNVTSMYEKEMLDTLRDIVDECHSCGIPVLAIMYPRKEIDGKDYNYLDVKANNIEKYTRLIIECVRIAKEYGADIIKTNYTGTVDSFKRVTEYANGIPIVIAGGPMIPIIDSYKIASDAMIAGASGTSYGRNVFNQEYIIPYIKGLKTIVFDGYNENDALEAYQKCLKLG